MVSNTKEVALERAIQKNLTGQTTEEMGSDSADIGNKPYRIGLPSDFNAQFALDTTKFWQFLQETQVKDRLASQNPGTL
jgi:type I restriction enzyme R subunit